MPTITITWYYPNQIERYEALEAKGKLGTRSAKVLAEWRRQKARYPNMTSMMWDGKHSVPIEKA